MSEHNYCSLLLPWLFFVLVACTPPTAPRTVTPLQPVTGRELQIVTRQTLYVPAYGEMFYGWPDRTTALAVTLAIHNTDLDAPIIIQSVQYFDTHGQLVRDYITEPVYVEPLATTGFLVEAGDQRGGWGANFIVTWGAEEPVYEPIVEAIMVSTSSGLGMSMISAGRVISQTLPSPTPSTTITPSPEQ